MIDALDLAARLFWTAAALAAVGMHVWAALHPTAAQENDDA